MSDRILMALMQLFAIVAHTDEVGAKGREVVERFLRRQLSAALVAKYLLAFDEFVETLRGKSEEGKMRKRTAVNSVKVLRICTEINGELEQKQKMIVLLRLLEFIRTTATDITEQHWEFIKTVSDTFGIPEADYDRCVLLTNAAADVAHFNDDSYLIIDKKSLPTGNYRHLVRENLSGRMIFLMINDPQLLLFTYSGSDNLVLDGREILRDSVQVFEPGSVIRGSKLSAVYYNDIIHNFLEYSVSHNLTFKVEKLGYVFKKGKIGLHELSFTATSKNFVAVMGNSGAGKTTLLNLLNGSVRPTAGRIMVNGIDLYENKKTLHRLIGNIPQDDLLIEELSVFQNLFYSSKLYFGDLTDDQIAEKVNACLKSLGLFEIRDLQVGDPLNKFISGGQRKRLNIALELIREPEILFVDEPTSGLSSNDAENVMDLLKQLSLAGKLIFVVIHQPSSEIFKLFDLLLLLDTGGYPVYYGNPIDSVSYFKHQMQYVDFERSECEECGNINPEELFRIMESKTVDEYGRPTGQRKITSNEWYQLFNQHFAEQGAPGQESATQGSGETNKVSAPLTQFWVYFQRNLFSKVNNRQYLAITLFEGPLLALILGVALRAHDAGKEYRFGNNPNIPVYIFICAIVALFLGLIVSADEIIQDKKILKRESFLQLSRNSYLLSKMAFLFVVSAVQSLLFVLVGNSILGFRELYGDYWMVLFSISCFANLLGLNISSGLKTRVAVYILIPFLVIPQIMLSGVLVGFDDLSPAVGSRTGVPAVGNIMAARWAYEALAVDQFKNNSYEKEYFDIDREISNAEYRKDYWIPAMRDRLDIAGGMLHRANVSADSLAEMNAFFKKELEKVGDEYPAIVKTDLSGKSMQSDGDAFVAACKTNLDSMSRYFIRRQNKAQELKQDLVEKANAKLGHDEYVKRKETYANSKLEDFVTGNGFMKDKVLVADNRMVRRHRPVFICSAEPGLFGAPYYAHNKSMFGMPMETKWFNMAIIWFMTAGLYITLYFDLLKKLLERE